MKIVVIGGTRISGKKSIPLLRQRGHEAVAASPSSGVNALTGEGLAEVLAGARRPATSARLWTPAASPPTDPAPASARRGSRSGSAAPAQGDVFRPSSPLSKTSSVRGT